ncbi:MAG: hypothetical protein H6807_15190 [Planctomycetes bacterium]|nr:hypothetical protein [Planctomycetota bacterium]
MALYLMDYDLRKNRNYKPLYDELASFSAVRILESTWCFNRINTSAANLRDHFKAFIDSDDGILIAEINDWATYGAEKTPKDLR